MQAKSQTTVIKGPAGDLEIRIKESLPKTDRPVAVISHPHPQFGGTMNNKVVTTIEKALQEKGYSTVVYNFRGVGQSQGAYDGGVGEMDDLLSVVAWARDYFATPQVCLAGFSFGSYITLKAQPQVRAERLLIVAPPVGLYDFSVIAEVEVPWEMVIGLEDEVVAVAEMLAWFNRVQAKPSLYARAQASHFFHGQLLWLKRLIMAEY